MKEKAGQEVVYIFNFQPLMPFIIYITTWSEITSTLVISFPVLWKWASSTMEICFPVLWKYAFQYCGNMLSNTVVMSFPVSGDIRWKLIPPTDNRYMFFRLTYIIGFTRIINSVSIFDKPNKLSGKSIITTIEYICYPLTDLKIQERTDLPVWLPLSCDNVILMYTGISRWKLSLLNYLLVDKIIC